MGIGKMIVTGIGGIVLGILAVLVGIIAIFIFATIGAIVGAVTGWIVGHTPILGDLVRTGFSSIFEVESPDLVAIGAMIGFIAGFFKNWDHKHDSGKWSDWCGSHKEKWPSEMDIPEVHIDVKPKRKRTKK